jgi:ABC-type transport system involved in cytochrome c biogenesis permease component
MRPLLALFIRALREDTRGKGTYLLRTALVLLILFFLWMTHQQQRWSGAVGREFFEAVLWIDLFIVSVAGLGYFASAITEEKEDGTLGLLRMTELNALAILLGKSTGRLVGALFLLAAQIPFALVAVTMGGVSVGQILAGYACLLSFTFLLANTGLLASVVCRRSGAAAVSAGGAIVSLIFAPQIIQWVQNDFGSRRTVLYLEGYGPSWLERFTDAWWNLTPVARLENILRTGFAGHPLDAQAAVNVALGVMCFAAAWALFEPCTRRALNSTDALDTGRSRLRRSERAIGLGAAAVRRKEFRTAGGRTRMSIKLTATLVVSGGWCWEAYCASSPSDSLGAGLFFTGAALLLLFLSIDAARVFSLERQQKNAREPVRPAAFHPEHRRGEDARQSAHQLVAAAADH